MLGPTRFALAAALPLILTLLAAGADTPAPGARAVNPPTPPAPARTRPLNIVCTTGMVADMVRAVAGDRASVEVLMGPGVDPHLFRPTRTEVERLARADAVFYNGLLLEGKMTETIERLGAGGKPVVAVTERLTKDNLRDWTVDPPGSVNTAAHTPSHDPHVWMDPVLWGRGIPTVRARLSELDPAGTPAFESNAAAYKARLEALDAYAKHVLDSVPERSRVLITAHDAFGYFGRRYGFQVEGIQGVSTESEAGVRDIQRLVELIVERGVKAVFVETSVSERNINALIDGVKAQAGRAGHDSGSITIGGLLFSDALGAAGTYEGTYLGMIDHNVTTIARALGGKAPERGMADRLAVPAR